MDPQEQVAIQDESDEKRRGLREALNGLNSDQRAVVRARLVQGKSSREVATELGWSVSRVDVTLFRARTALRTALVELRPGAS